MDGADRRFGRHRHFSRQGPGVSREWQTGGAPKKRRTTLVITFFLSSLYSLILGRWHGIVNAQTLTLAVSPFATWKCPILTPAAR